MAGNAQFQWDDPLLLDAQLTSEERMIRDAAAAYANDKLATRVTEAFRHETTDPALFREMGEIGLLGPTIPEQYGGPGLSYVAYGLIAREVERVERLHPEDVVLAVRHLLADRGGRRQRGHLVRREIALGQGAEHFAADIAGGANHRYPEAHVKNPSRELDSDRK